MLRKTFVVIVCISMFWSCKDQTPNLPDISVPPPEPSIHIIDNDLYFQFTWGKPADTMTYEVLDDSTSWQDSNFVNLAGDVRNEEVFDTAGSSAEQLFPPFPKFGWHYAPFTRLVTKKYRDLIIDNANPNVIVDQIEIDEAEEDIVTLYFPFSITDTLAFWDIQDYIDNPSIREDFIRWGRVGNNTIGDTLWNNDAQPGAVISYLDTAGVEWRSDNPPTFQPFGYFRISKVEANLKDYESYNFITGDFSVRLYNDKKESKDMKNAKFRLRIISDIELGPEPQ